MSVALYAAIPEDVPSFDGGKAWRHLCRGLGFRSSGPGGNDGLASSFEAWPSVTVAPK